MNIKEAKALARQYVELKTWADRAQAEEEPAFDVAAVARAQAQAEQIEHRLEHFHYHITDLLVLL